MNRFLFFLAILILPAVFSWWLFIPLALLSVFLIKLPFEIILVGFWLDQVYYFGDGFWSQYPLFMFALALLLGAWFLSDKIHWQRKI